MFTKSIAIVGDDQDLLNMYSEALKMSGYSDVSSLLTQLQHMNILWKIQINIH
jgi:hypothetical protein